jgi:hypothetical protein
MANETTTTTADDTVITALHRALMEELRPLVLPFKSLFMQADPFGAGRTVQIAKITDPGAAAGVAEATDLTNTAISTGAATVTASEQAIMATPTDVLSEASEFDAYAWVREVLVRSLAERLNDQFCALFSGFTNVTGTSGSPLTLTQFISAVSALAQRDVPGPYTAILHPVQVFHLQTATGGILSGPANSNFLANPALKQSIMDSVQRDAYAGSLMGVDIWQTTSVVTANAGADRAGVVASKDAIAWHQLRDFRVELQRDASLRATEIVASYNLGVARTDDPRGQAVITKATA